MLTTKKPQGPVEIFYAYSHADEDLRNDLDKHLRLLQRQGVITGWHDRKITAGQEWEVAIDRRLEHSRIILLLVSADFIASDYCYGKEMKKALGRHHKGLARVIPVILRSVYWSDAPFGKLQALPIDGKAVTSWPNRDEAFTNVAKGIQRAVEELDAVSAPVARSGRGRKAKKDPVESEVDTLPGADRSESEEAKSESASLKRNQLPASLIPFVGRKKIVQKLVNILKKDGTRGDRLIILTGPPGVGKSRIALEVAARLKDYLGDQVFRVPLENVGSTSFLLSEIAKVLRVEETVRPERRTLQENIEALLSDKQVVLILDAFDRFVSERDLIVRLLEASPRLKVLVTSRALLGIIGERIELVPPMELPDLQRFPSFRDLAKCEAISLFVERAERTYSPFRLDESNVATVARLCYELDRLPLALILAATHIRTSGLEGMLQELNNRLQFLGSRFRSELALEISYHSLDSDQEKTLFRRLSVFRGSFGPDAVMNICYTEITSRGLVLEQIRALVNSSLVNPVTSDVGEVRYEMLRFIRDYAQELMEADALDNAIDIPGRHAAYYHVVAEQAYRSHRGKDHYKLYKELTADRENLYVAMEHFSSTDEPKRIQMALELSGHIYGFWTFGEPLSTARLWLRKLLDHPIPPSGRASRAKALYADGRLAWLQGDHEAAWPELQESISIWKSLGEEFDEPRAYAMMTVASLYADKGKILEAVRTLRESKLIFIRVGSTWGAALCNTDLGRILYGRRYTRWARILVQESFDMFRSLEDPWGMATSGAELGCVEYLTGDTDLARQHLQEALKQFQGNNDNLAVAYVLTHLGNTERLSGNFSEATRNYKESFRLWEEAANPHAMALALLGLSHVVAGYDKNWERAAELMGAAESLLRDSCAHLDYNSAKEWDSHRAILISMMGAENFKRAYSRGTRKSKDFVNKRATSQDIIDNIT